MRNDRFTGYSLLAASGVLLSAAYVAAPDGAMGAFACFAASLSALCMFGALWKLGGGD